MIINCRITLNKNDATEMYLLENTKMLPNIIETYGSMFLSQEEINACKGCMNMVNVVVVEEDNEKITYDISYNDEVNIDDTVMYLGELN